MLRTGGGVDHRTSFLMIALALAGCAPHQVEYVALESPPAETRTVLATLFLVGDAGEANAARDSVLARLGRDVAVASADGRPVVAAYLGDNIYEQGARAEHLGQDRPKLEAQIAPLPAQPNVRGVFLPGNHGWAKGASTADARQAIRLQREWVEQLAADRNVAMLPDDACPGPATLDVEQSLHLVFIDTEWLLREPVDACGGADGFYTRLSADLRAQRGVRVVIMSHHPLATGGPHGGNVHPLSNGPLVYYLARKAGVSVQDLASARYTGMVMRLGAAFEAGGGPPLVFASGHDHNLQVIRTEGPGMPTYQLVSGSGAKASNARRLSGTRYATNGHGYMRLDFTPSDVRLAVFAQTDDDGTVTMVFTCTLSSTDCPEAALVQRRP